MDVGIAREVTQELMDDSKLVETGWRAYLSLARDPQMREAFFMGAYHIFSSLLLAADDTPEVTEHDERRLDQLHEELLPFGRAIKGKYQLS